MRLSFIIPIFISFLVIINGCVDEPFIEPVKAPYSVVRVINNTANVNNINITIDGAQPVAELANLGPNAVSTYFDLKSGKRTFLVKNVATGDIMYNKQIEIHSYERITVIFAGNFSTVDTLRTFSVFTFDEGEVYVSGAPKDGRAHVYLIHSSAASPTHSSKKLSFSAKYKTTIDTTYKDTVYISTPTLDFSGIKSLPDVYPGNYIFSVISSAADTITYTTDLSAGKRYYLFVVGEPNNMQIVKNEILPLSVRSK